MLAFVLSAMLLAPSVFGAPAYSAISANASLNAFLQSYKVSNSTISGSSYYLINYNGSAFVVVNETDGQNLLLHSASGTYTFILNSTLAYDVMQPYYLQRFFPGNTTIDNLSDAMESYRSQAQPSLTSCLEETGIYDQVSKSIYVCSANTSLSSVATCMQNTCQHVPICGGTFPASAHITSELQNFGVPSFFATGVQNLSVQYNRLNKSYSAFLNITNTLNKSDIASQLSALSRIEGNISAISQILPENPLFPPPVNASPSYLESECSFYNNVSQAPWYCASVDFCGYTNFNKTELSGISSTIAQLSQEPLSEASIMARVNSTILSNDNVFAPVALASKFAAVSSAKAAIATLYDGAVLNSTSLLTKISDAQLSNALASLNAAFLPFAEFNASANVLSLNDSQQSFIIGINTIKVNTSVEASAVKLHAIYENLSAQYAAIRSIAQDNTALLLAAQLNYQGSPPQSLASASAEQQQLNIELNGRVNVSQFPAITNSLVSVSTQAGSLASTPFSLPAITKAFDSGIISMVESSPTEPVSSKTVGAPLIAAAISFIAGIIILGIIYELTFAKLKRNKKIKLNPKVRRAWSMLFGLLFLLVLAYTYTTYSFASSANSFLPASAFVSALQQSKAATIAINGTASAPMVPCATALENGLNQTGKVVKVIYIQNDSCTSGSSGSLTGAACFNSAVSSGPVIVLSASNSSSIAYKGMYGNILYISGPAASGASCEALGLFKVS
jgi:hypothetical protein